MRYLLVVLAVVLVPVVAQNQSSVPRLTCPSVCFQASRQLDKLQKQLNRLKNSGQVDQQQDALLLLNNRLNRLENIVLQEKASSVCFQVSRQLDKLQKQLKRLDQLQEQLNRQENSRRGLDQLLNRLAENIVLQEKASSVCFQVSRQLDQQQEQLNRLENSRQQDQLQEQLNRLENSRRLDQLQELLNRLGNAVLQEKACARATVAEGLPLSLTINSTACFSILALDCGGYDLTTGGDNVTATFTSVDYPSCVSPEPTVVDNGDGSYQVSLTPECSGNNLVSVSINGKKIKDMPVTVAVIPPYTSLRLKRTITSVNHPHSIEFSENGDAYVGGFGDHHVHHFDRNGKKLKIWRTPGNNDVGVLVHGNNIYVSQCTPPKVYNYTQSGMLLGSAFIDGCYNDLVIGPDGRLYASDVHRKLISIFNMEDGSLFHQITGTPDPRGIGFDLDGNLHFSRWGSRVIQVFTRSGVLLRSYTPPSGGKNDGLFIDKAGNVLVADHGTPSKVIITDKNNNLLHKLILGPGHTPVNVAIAPNGDAWVANAESKTLIYSV